jgi:hypothetical protein
VNARIDDQGEIKEDVGLHLAGKGGEHLADLVLIRGGRHFDGIANVDVDAPIGGEVLAVNEELADDPEKINADPYGDGWIVRLQPAGDDGETMTPDEYQAFLDELDD